MHPEHVVDEKEYGEHADRDEAHRARAKARQQRRQDRKLLVDTLLAEHRSGSVKDSLITARQAIDHVLNASARAQELSANYPKLVQALQSADAWLDKAVELLDTTPPATEEPA